MICIRFCIFVIFSFACNGAILSYSPQFFNNYNCIKNKRAKLRRARPPFTIIPPTPMIVISHL